MIGKTDFQENMPLSFKSPMRLVVRCFAEEVSGGQWQAFTLQLGLAAQGDSFPEVKQKLESMLESYVYDALVGEDRKHAAELMGRRAAPFVYARYWSAVAEHKVRALLSPKRRARRSPHSHRKVFREPMPLAPCH